MQLLTSEWFATPIWTGTVADAPALNRALETACYALRERDPGGSQNTNVHGWQSQADIQHEPDFSALIPKLLEACKEAGRSAHFKPDARYFIEAWANINPPGAYNLVHTHPNCHLSGCYYISAPPDSGRLFFRDPRPAVHVTCPPVEGQSPLAMNNLRVPPEPGRLYIFPAWLEHGVEPNAGRQDRLGVAFNIVARDRPGGNALADPTGG